MNIGFGSGSGAEESKYGGIILSPDSEFIPQWMKCIYSLSACIDTLSERIDQLEAENIELRTRINKLEQKSDPFP